MPEDRGVHPPAGSRYLVDASGYRGAADRLFLPESEAEVAQILREASAANESVTISGAGTGVTGGSISQGGWLVCLERLKKMEIGDGAAVCGPGVLLRDLQQATAPRQFYAPDPTETSASLGGTIATNASGSRGYLYGPTRHYVRRLRVVLASGEVLAPQRGEKAPFDVPVLPAPAATKNTAGYYLRADIDYLDLFIGSEGTLGIVTEAELTLLPTPADLSTGVLFFESDEAALDAVDRWRHAEGLRMLEYMDAASLELLRPRYAEIPAASRACILVEGTNDEWIGGFTGMENSWFATSVRDREWFRQFRHALPEAVNDLIRKRNLTKMGSDFAVPIARNREMLRIYRETLDREFPQQYVIFGHIGDAHLHVNILPANEAEWRRGNELMSWFARQAFELGGTVSAEHGVGKRKRHLLTIQYTPQQMDQMKSVKTMLDPKWMLGPGNLFDKPI